jgi:predicted DNA-binding transcriptional regulator AlpA
MSIAEKLDRIIQILENEKQEEQDRLMNINEVVAYIGNRYKKSTIYSMACNGTIPCTHKPLRFKKSEIDNWLKN